EGTGSERRESIELAFIAALQRLPSRQRAVLLLRDVLGLAPAEIAAALDTTPTAIYSLLQRARQTADERLPARSQQAMLRTIGDRSLRELVERYVQAWDEGDVAAITEMLADDASFSMPPRPSWYRGRAAIGTFLAAVPLSGRWRWRHVPIRANGQLSFGAYLLDGAGRGHAHAIQVLAVDTNARISDITVFHTPEAFARFGLPAAFLPSSGRSEAGWPRCSGSGRERLGGSEGVGDRLPQLIQRERLLEDAPRAEQPGRSERGTIVACRDDDDGWRGGQRRQLRQQSEP